MCSCGVLVCGVSAGGAAGSGHAAEPQTAALPATGYLFTGGSGTVTSSLAGISCQPTCKTSFAAGTLVKLTAFPAILRLIETRFKVPALTKRDAAQINMTQFFNFNVQPWMTPPTRPLQNPSGSSYLNQLP